MNTPALPALLSLLHISKRFGATQALDDVTIAVHGGEVHALLGENGAGKSTLMRIAYGMVRPDAGAISVTTRGMTPAPLAAFDTPRTALKAGIGMVHQHFSSIAALSVAENIALAAGWKETGGRAVRRARTLIERLGLPLDAAATASSLSVQLRQRLEIVKAMAADAHVLLLDEPTAALAPREIDQLLAFLREFVTDGKAAVLITHKLDEVIRAADRVTVLRQGHVMLTSGLVNQTVANLARAMMGSERPAAPRGAAVVGAVLVRADSVMLDSRRGQAVAGNRHRFGPASFALRAGEVVGIAAIDGNGQRELLRAIAGVDRVELIGGRLTIDGPVAFIPEDRSTEGLIPSFTLTENLLLGTFRGAPLWLDWPGLRARTRTLIETRDVRAGGPDVEAASLSGGNQQKFLLARALADRPRVIVAEDPTRGLDLLATAAIHRELRDAARGGAAVIVHASDLDEVLDLSDRVLVVAAGRLREMPVNSSRDAVGEAMLGVPAA